MEKMLLMLASAMSTENIIDKLEQAVEEYQHSPSEETKNGVAAICALFLAHLKTGGTMEGAMEAMKDFDKFDEREKLFNPNKN